MAKLALIFYRSFQDSKGRWDREDLTKEQVAKATGVKMFCKEAEVNEIRQLMSAAVPTPVQDKPCKNGSSIVWSSFLPDDRTTAEELPSLLAQVTALKG